jgi:hypothetical protein
MVQKSKPILRYIISVRGSKNAAIHATGDAGSKRYPGVIVSNRDKLQDILKILSPDEAVRFVRSKIQERDNFNKPVVNEFGGEYPEWTGRDPIFNLLHRIADRPSRQVKVAIGH